MKVLKTRKALISWRQRHRGSLGFVPTMGALHQGHLHLVERARRESSKVVVSIFVNPTQFGPGEDFRKYPRTLSRDLALLRKAGVAAVFCPRDASQVYEREDETRICPPRSLASILEGRFRPGHFDGVATVVYKLFSWIRPTYAYFGEKDYQQLKVIEALVRDFCLPLVVRAVPTQREPTGLALSSRNAYLSASDRQYAAHLHTCLKMAPSIREARKRILRLGFKIDYVEAWKTDLTAPATKPQGRVRWLAAVRWKGVRLIDNVLRDFDT